MEEKKIQDTTKVAVKFFQVYKKINKVQILNNINLNILSGKVIVICGPSGSGKSTLVRLINRLEEFDNGEIFIYGKPISNLQGNALRKLRMKIGFVFQKFNLYENLNVLNNVALSLIKIQNWEKEKAHQHAIEKLKEVGLLDKIKSYPHELSGGQQQRVAIARVLASNVQIIIFDEPTSALDPEMISEVMIVIKNLIYYKITMIVVTHEIQFAQKIADQIVFLSSGEILEKSDPKNFFSNPKHPRAKKFLKKILFPLKHT
ncbi:GlnQ family glutamine transport ATP-binding protein [Wigglesworthia glossinidia endosymbiont of Glossina morsitans morsitans (Yale colony)]|uniref:GlnQ family glutamine transport ATP-binding protein n=1 Tax=Wigglesworthia glossinidia endosymbiont of Glossina morsitans morsitans (Yale colony) TaxID=1142511 RepID=H6Q5C3_WIGGL|nr:amino acid ABC transporter ATP-binding protein [Wigglesworthia glossinidia]AFA41408.1 GlnQ family glutamine transport ATP-binding protein [Wigglesworthia glossinidia endosymbiont of Glossina morsitans morsitans (Yale colony)]